MSTLNDRDIRRCMAIVRNELIIKNGVSQKGCW